ncbi:hypothetical protein WV31_19215 [Magnetospirillum sp. ME-1]|uniref:sigma-70 family RNA polymerase sigma factor n=1 Tax=Magnetospirillum sp. ME-1 TaxID=1639348 RepID=UPI000A17E267|nr:sigma-70 family RNA polymerase sigma factor [Magnetospirillum sp. ME-1]ARJ67632.1 hypothetical protein WV31_19215 [Magnetospirillum sp. ME-1]
MASSSREALEARTNEELALLWQRERQPAAREILIGRFEGYAKGHAVKRRYLATVDDVRQEVRMAVIDAIDAYDPARGGSLATVVDYKRKERLTAMITQRTLLSGIDAKVIQVHASCMRKGMDSEQAVLATAAKRRRKPDRVRMAVERNVPVAGFDDLQQDPASEDPVAAIMERIERKELRPMIAAALAGLPERDRRILLACDVGRDDRTASYQQVADAEGISRERVRQLLHRARGRLRDALVRMDSELALRAEDHRRRTAA